MKLNITIVDQCKLQIAAWGKTKEKIINMTPYAGQHVRIWLDKDGSYSLNSGEDHFWQAAELDVPEIEYQQINTNENEIDDAGETMTASKPMPLDLTNVKIILWELPV